MGAWVSERDHGAMKNGSFFWWLTGMSVYMCITCQGNTKHQDALWGEGQSAEAEWCFGQCSAGKPWSYSLMAVASFSMIMGPVTKQKLFRNGYRKPTTYLGGQGVHPRSQWETLINVQTTSVGSSGQLGSARAHQPKIGHVSLPMAGHK